MTGPAPLGVSPFRKSIDNSSNLSRSSNSTFSTPSTTFPIVFQSAGPEATKTTLENLKTITTPQIAELMGQAALAEALPEAERETLDQLFRELDQMHPADIAKSAEGLFKENTSGVSYKGLTLLLKAINTKLMILNAAEIHLAASRLNKNDSIAKGLDQWSKSSSASSSKSNLSQLKARPVITGHPTLVNKPETLQTLLDQVGKFRSEDEMQDLCKIVWEGQGGRPQKPTVQEEAAHFAQIVQNILKSSHRVQKVVNTAAESLGIDVPDRNMVEPGNWVAGDRDGNPTIKAGDLLSVVAKYSASTFNFYLDKLSDKAMKQEFGPNPSLCRLLRQAGKGGELNAIIEKLENTQLKLSNQEDFDLSSPHYTSPDELIADLDQLELGALDLDNQESANLKIARLQSDIRTFGFHGVNTDIRQNSAMNEKTVASLLKLSGIEDNYHALPENERVNLLARLLQDDSKFPMHTEGSTENPDFSSEIELIKAYKAIHETYGNSALKNCITANSETASDMLEVMVLLKHAGLMEKGQHMNVMPLIETVEDLRNAPAMLDKVLELPWYRQQLESAENIQHIMVGYSDSNRLDGPLSSSWAVHECVNKLLDVARKHGVQLMVFHGRGGTEARGSGHSYSQDISYLDGESVALGVRQTEQGEEVPIKFGNQELADANLADMIGTTLTTASRGSDTQVKQHSALMNSLSAMAQEKYHSLYSHEKLAEFFRRTTPISLIGLSNAGSRPASRKVATTDQEYLAQMRAIPWTAAWYQTGNLMPAYFGIGTALNQHILSEGNHVTSTTPKVDELRSLYKKWPFFKNVIDRTDMALYKTDMDSAAAFAQLDPSTGEVFEMIKSERDLTRAMVQLVKQTHTDVQEMSAKQALDAKTNLRKFTQHLQAGLINRISHYPNSADSELQKQLLVMTIQATSNSYGRHG